MNATLLYFFCTLSAIGLLVLSPSSGSAAPSSLEQTIFERNPELQALRARLEAARARRASAGAWMDPRLSLELMDTSSLAGPKLTFSQMIPLQGQPALMARMAEVEAEMVQAQLIDRSLMLLANARQAVIELDYAAQLELILAKGQDLTGRMSRISEAKYAVGKGMQADILRAHVARTKLFEPLLALASKRASARASLEAIAPGYVPEVTPSLGSEKLAALGELLAQAEIQSPMLRMKRLELQHAEQGVALAQAERVPDLELGSSLGRQMPGDMPYWSTMVSMTLPVWLTTKQHQRVLAAEHLRAEAQRALDNARLDLVARITSVHAMTLEAEQRLVLYQGGLLVQAQQTFKATLAAYQVNQGDFLMVLDSQMALNDLEMAEAMAHAERRKSMAMLQALVGERFEDWRRP